MATASSLLRQEAAEPRCFFCGTALADAGAAFLDHVASSQGCRDRYDGWMSHIDEDRPGG
ncbi:MAG TPA: hypothetical protein VGR28_09855 [Candidatus Thermoplasmatota archaeon]|jgi:hypothetical protein|nr:hypothetical protein [Candidatus Thermoplasmatota archaeon]